MRTITVEQALYNYNELSENAKYKVQEYLDYPWCEDNMDSLNKFAKLFDLKIVDYSIDLSGSFCSRSYINWRFKGDIEELQYIRLYKYLSNNYSDYINDKCDLTGYCMDNSLMYHLIGFLKRPYDISITDLFNKCIEEFKKDYLADCEAYYKEENMIEMCNDNEYEFCEDGTLA